MKIELFQKLLLSYLNIPYIYGGKNPLTGEDCSGLVCEFLKALGKIGTNEEFNAQQLFNKYVKPMAQTPASLPMPAGEPALTGSLVFYGADVSHVDHVAMLIDNEFIIEAGHGTADTLTKDIASQRGAFTRIRPYKYRADFLQIVNLDLGLTL